MSIAGCLPDELLERRADEERRDHEESVRLLYVAATRARDLLVVPVVGDRERWSRNSRSQDGCAGWRRWFIRSRTVSAPRNRAIRRDVPPLAKRASGRVPPMCSRG